MVNDGLNILIISFYFPPYNKVGGRRWAKHCKYLIQSKIKTFVLAGNFKGSSPWDKDIQSFKKNIFRIDHTNNLKPFYQTKLPLGIFEKIKWKLSYYSWQIFKKNKKGNYNDPSVNNELNYLNKAIEVINDQKINTVILSVGPFKYSSILIELKKQFPKINFVIDYRDYWEDSLPGLSNTQKESELELQKKVVSCVDLIMSPNMEMQNFYASKFNKNSYCLPHCFDHTDFNYPEIKNSSLTDISLIYGGAFYSEINENIDVIKKFINELSKKKNIKADFYVSIKGYEKELMHPAIKRFDFIDSKNYFEKVNASDLAILILPPSRVNAMSSKFFELLALRKPILYFGGAGAVSDFLLKHQLGFHVTKQNIVEQVEFVLKNFTDHKIPNKNYDLNAYTFQYQTKLLIEQLNKL